MTLIASTLANITVGEASTFQNLTIFPLLKGGHHAAGYHTLDEALKLGGIRVTEVSEDGSVNELKVLNTLDLPVLLLDGQELVGAKQNRVFNLTILVPANTELLVPVSCVEAGRWRHSSAAFKTAGRAQYAAGRAERVSQVSDSLALRGLRASDQSAVWRSIAAKESRMGVESETGAMADMYERFEGTVDEYVQGLPAVEGQVGAIFLVSAEIIGLDLFDSESTLHSLLATLVRSHALDALESPRAEATPTADAAVAFLKAVSTAPNASFKAVGLGDDVRLRDAAVSGAALSADGELVHLCAYPAGEGRR